MITLIKLGGSLITDKNKPKFFRKEVVQRLASEIKSVIKCTPVDKYIIGHGSGSFGHFEAKKYGTIHSVTSEEQWLGFTKVAHIASELSQLVTHELVEADLPFFRIQPSASSIAENGTIQSMDTMQIKRALANNLIPLIHGDVAFDIRRGGTITSTEAIFSYLIDHLDINRIILLGEVDGVLDHANKVIPMITADSFQSFKSSLGGSDGVDVTGGMYQKVKDMLQLVERQPDLEIIIANGGSPNTLVDLICKNQRIGTRITSN